VTRGSRPNPKAPRDPLLDESTCLAGPAPTPSISADVGSDAFAKASLLVSEVQVYGIESLKYILHLRGIFQSYTVRKHSTAVLPGSTGLEAADTLDDEGKRVIREILSYLKPNMAAECANPAWNLTLARSWRKASHH
jgi:hypothetical protein